MFVFSVDVLQGKAGEHLQVAACRHSAVFSALDAVFWALGWPSAFVFQRDVGYVLFFEVALVAVSSRASHGGACRRARLCSLQGLAAEDCVWQPVVLHHISGVWESAAGLTSSSAKKPQPQATCNVCLGCCECRVVLASRTSPLIIAVGDCLGGHLPPSLVLRSESQLHPAHVCRFLVGAPSTSGSASN